ncbi:MAG: hypothetical protein V1728_05650 [Candidatus Micrarchaeota archaeon]
MFVSKAQGSTEYLVLFGAVMVIVLVAISLISSNTSLSQSTTTNSNAAYWNEAAPFAIPSDPLSSAGNGYVQVALSVENHAARELTMTNFALTIPGGATAVSNATSFIFSPGEAKTIIVYSASGANMQDCTNLAGRYVPYTVKITYTDGPLAGKVQVGNKQLMVLCT